MPRVSPMTQSQKDRKKALRLARERANRTKPTPSNPEGLQKPYNPGPWKSPEPKPWERLGIK